jgi:hypothetical protein
VAERGVVQRDAFDLGDQQRAQVAVFHDASEQREALRPRQIERDVERRGIRGRALVGGRKLGGVALVSASMPVA